MEITTKRGQASTYSPRTQDNNRRRLADLFAFATASGSPVSSRVAKKASNLSNDRCAAHGNGTENDTDADADADAGIDSERKQHGVNGSGPRTDVDDDIVDNSHLDSPTRQRFRCLAVHDTCDTLVDGREVDEGCYVDTRKDWTPEETVGHDGAVQMGGMIAAAQSEDGEGLPGPLSRLPDELLLVIISHLPLSASQLLVLARVNRRFQALSSSNRFWADLFHSTRGYALTQNAQERVVASAVPLPGEWIDGEWRWNEVDPPQIIPHDPEPPATVPSTPASSPTPALTPVQPQTPVPASIPDASRSRSGPIPVHYPTLYRMRRTFSDLIRSPTPSHRPTFETLRKHSNSVYCLHSVGRWLMTGSRDRSVRLWRLGSFSADGTPTRTRLIKTVLDAHLGSVLSLHFTLDEQGRGTLMTGSSDRTAALWDLDFSGRPIITRTTTLTGHVQAVLDVVIAPEVEGFVSASKDGSVRVYDREGGVLRVMGGHDHPVNCLALGPGGREIVGASGDGCWVVWDLKVGEERRRSAGKGRGLACVAWEGEYIVTGDNDRLIKLYNAETTELLRTFTGHTDLVRTVAINLNERIIVSGSYDASIRMWDLDTGLSIRRVANLVQTEEVAEPQTRLILDLQVTTTRIISVSHDNSVHVVCLATGLPYLNIIA